MWRILAVVVDEVDHTALSEALAEDGFTLEIVTDLDAAQIRLDDEQFHLLVVDDAVVGERTGMLTGMIDEHMRLVLLVDVKQDAERYGTAGERWTLIRRPINPTTLRNTLRALKSSIHLPQAMDYLRHAQPYIYNFDNIIAVSRKMKDVLELVRKIADSSSSVLVQGETGTGKELIAAAIHFNSPRRQENFVAVNCAALHENLLESELFGHEKGAFTGAHKRRFGRFEQADGGTLFLDEIGDMSISTQAKVLRVLQEQRFERLGGTQTVHVDVRIIAATNRPLERMIEEKLFREDLYFRLNVIPIFLPPLRERREDIMPLVDFFLRRLCRERGRPAPELAPETVEALQRYAWPGNIRELANVVERAILIGGDARILPADLALPGSEAVRVERAELDDLDLDRLERRAIEQALAQCHGVQKEAAKLLGISPRAIHYKIRKHEIDPAPYADEGER